MKLTWHKPILMGINKECLMEQFVVNASSCAGSACVCCGWSVNGGWITQ